MLDEAWRSIQHFILLHADDLHAFAEVVKILGALASFYALIKLRSIERKYLFKATIPSLIGRIDHSLQSLNEGLNDPSRQRLQIRTALNHLLADVKAVKRRVTGDSRRAVNGFMTFMRPLGFEPYFWQRQLLRDLSKDELSEIYVRGRRLIRLLENELDDSVWSSR